MPHAPHDRARRMPPEAAPPVSNARLAVIVLIAAESMLFAGLIGSYLVFRLSAASWPPTEQPRLPLAMTTLNTLVLFASLLPMTSALRAVRKDDREGLVRALQQTVLLGALFLVVQGAEWARLVSHGLTLASGMYGATFYLLIGCHGLHVLIAVLWLAVTVRLARQGALSAGRHAVLEMCTFYWYFVCALWAVLFPLVYLY